MAVVALAGLHPAGTLAGRTVSPRVTTAPIPSLRYWRVQRALHQEELATQARVSMATIWRLETGRPATLDTIRRLAEALDVQPADLMRPPPTELRRAADEPRPYDPDPPA